MKNNQTCLDLKSVKKGLDDIVARKVCPPTWVRTALAKTIEQRAKVTAIYVKFEEPHVSKSTIGHQKFTEELVSMKALLDTIEASGSSVQTGRPVVEASNANPFNSLAIDQQGDEEGAMDIVFEDDGLWLETLISQGMFQLVHVLIQGTARFKTGIRSPGALAEAAWVALGAHELTIGICYLMKTQSGLDWADLLNKMDELHTRGELEALQTLPIHEYVKQFIGTAEEVAGGSSSAVSKGKLKTLKTAAAKTIQNDLQHSKRSNEVLKLLLVDSRALGISMPDHNKAWLLGTWCQKLPLVQKFIQYRFSDQGECPDGYCGSHVLAADLRRRCECC